MARRDKSVANLDILLLDRELRGCEILLFLRRLQGHYIPRAKRGALSAFMTGMSGVMELIICERTCRPAMQTSREIMEGCYVHNKSSGQYRAEIL